MSFRHFENPTLSSISDENTPCIRKWLTPNLLFNTCVPANAEQLFQLIPARRLLCESLVFFPNRSQESKPNRMNNPRLAFASFAATKFLRTRSSGHPIPRNSDLSMIATRRANPKIRNQTRKKEYREHYRSVLLEHGATRRMPRAVLRTRTRANGVRGDF